MKLIEITCTTDKNGGLKVPREIMKDMGVLEGDHIRLAYLSEYGEINTYHEFFLSSNGLDSTHAVSDPQKVIIPNELLSQADITENADIQIVCSHQMIVIFQSTRALQNDLGSVLNSLEAATDILKHLVCQIHMGSQLEELLKHDV